MKKKVVQILYGGLGGHASVAFSLIEGDRQKEFEHRLLFFGIEELTAEYRERCDKNGITFQSIVKKGKLPLNDWRKVYKCLSDWQPDVIVLHSTTLIFPMVLFHKLKKCRLIFVEHTPNHIKSRNEWLASRWGMRFADKVVFLTDVYRVEMVKALGAKYRKEKVTVIPNGIDVALFSPDETGEAQAQRDIGMIGRFSITKNQEELIDCFHQLVSNGQLADWKLHLAGDGTSLAPLKEKVKQYKLQDRVLFYGNIREDQIVSFLRKIRIYVHATKGETMSTAIMQAMACGLPVIGTNVAGVSNMIDDGNTGLLYQSSGEPGLAQCLIAVIENDPLRLNLARNARSYALEHYSLEKMFMRYKSVF